MEPGSARKIQSFVELLKQGKNCERTIEGRVCRFVFYSDDEPHCDIYVGSFVVATVWNTQIQFTLPKPINSYIRMRVNSSRVNCQIQWREDYKLSIKSAELNRLVKVGLTKRAKVECFIGNRLLAQFTHDIDRKKDVIVEALRVHGTCDVRLEDNKTGVEAFYTYARQDSLLASVNIVFPLEFVNEEIGTLRVACLENIQEKQNKARLMHQQHEAVTAAAVNFDDVSADLYMKDDWDIYTKTINTLSKMCVVKALDNGEAPVVMEDWVMIGGAPLDGTLEMGVIESNDVMVTYFRVEDVDQHNFELTESDMPQKRIVWRYKNGDGNAQWMPFTCRQLFKTAAKVWDPKVLRRACSVIKTTATADRDHTERDQCCALFQCFAANKIEHIE